MGRRSGLIGVGLLVLLIVFVGGVLSSHYMFNSEAANRPAPPATPIVSPTRSVTPTHTVAPQPTPTTIASATTQAMIPTSTVTAVTPTSTATAEETRTPRPRPLSTPANRDATTSPAAVIANYYNAVNQRRFDRAYSYIGGAFTDGTAEATFAKGYADTQSVTVVQLTPADYRLLTDKGLTLTCIGFKIVAHSKAGPSETYGGWYKVLRRTGPWSIDLALSHSDLNGQATIPTAKRCGRGLRVVGAALPASTVIMPAVTLTPGAVSLRNVATDTPLAAYPTNTSVPTQPFAMDLCTFEHFDQTNVRCLQSDSHISLISMDQAQLVWTDVIGHDSQGYDENPATISVLKRDGTGKWVVVGQGDIPPMGMATNNRVTITLDHALPHGKSNPGEVVASPIM